MQMLLQVFIEKVHKSQHIASLNVAFHCRMQVFRIPRLEKPREQRRKSKLCCTCFMTVAKCIYGNNKPLLNKNSLRTTEAQFVQKLKNNKARPRFTGSYFKKTRVACEHNYQSVYLQQVSNHFDRLSKY